MASEFLQQKHSWLFHFFDHSKNGSIDINDFKARAERATNSIKDFYAQQEGGEDFLKLNLETISQAQENAHVNFFDHLCSEIDKDCSGSISPDEWLAFCSKIADHVRSNGELPEWFTGILNEYFDKVLDIDGSGYIDLYELAFMGDAPLDVAWYCFNYLTNDGKEALTKENFLKFTKDYISTEDSADVSRYIFGFIPHA